ncbi:MAG: hypothetical protein HYX61_02100 [Gammaproteobacteria bacterium]|jgi:ankyrin repeat protein|nr:hypothetical protein [Gammaproteobacteria bacterium]
MLSGPQKQFITLIQAQREDEALVALDKLDCLDFQDLQGNNILHHAQNQDLFNLAKEIVSRQPNLRTQANQQKRSPLHDAAEQNKIDFVRLYLHLYIENHHFPCELEGRAEKERTPLHLAAIKGHEKVAMLLKEAGANLEAKDIGNYSSFDYAYVMGHQFATLLQPPKVPSLFTLAAIQAFKAHPDLSTAIAECVFQQAQTTVLFHQQNQEETAKKTKSVEQSRSKFFDLVETFKSLRLS